jgi:hypothetical protein
LKEADGRGRAASLGRWTKNDAIKSLTINLQIPHSFNLACAI